MTPRALSAIGLVLAHAWAAGCAPTPSDPVILQVGEQTVRRSEFERYVRRLESQGGPLSAAARRGLLDTFLEERLLVLEARARKLLGAVADLEEERAAIETLLAQTALLGVGVSQEEADAYCRERVAEHQLPETVTLRQILVMTQNEARDVARRLQRDPKSFEQLARTRSVAPEAASGGLMGVFARGQLPAELERAAFELAEGRHSPIIETPLGYHVLRLDSRQPAREMTHEECREAGRAKLLREKQDRAVKAFVAELLSKAKVNHEAAQAVRPS